MIERTEITIDRKDRIKLLAAIALQGMLAGDKYKMPSNVDISTVLDEAIRTAISLDEKVDAIYPQAVLGVLAI